jgi:hypothetical protein
MNEQTSNVNCVSDSLIVSLYTFSLTHFLKVSTIAESRVILTGKLLGRQASLVSCIFIGFLSIRKNSY